MTNDRGDATTSASRRRFLASTIGSLAICPLLSACEYIDVYDTEFEDRGGFPFSLEDPDFAALSEVGGHACVELGPIDVLLLRANDEEVIGVERICPHQNLEIAGCGDQPLAPLWNEEQQQLTCRWHQSVFAKDGSRVSGPAPRGLRLFPVTFDAEAGTGVLMAGGAGGGPPGATDENGPPATGPASALTNEGGEGA